MQFVLDMEQSVKAGEFIRSHKHEDMEHGAIGGSLTYSFTNTGLGQVSTVECGICNEKLDLTDYDEW